ncbi:hypothetical protein CB0940_03844 [Cercospora beticola]|uniref:Prion-inhibition and propagation HeLo domain-containing protein n=1 Tax=Cercospora beticola TaxID=122368 RepID=A0A2G5HM96_CERBT|nr:hypothetical protein CB0940_03844 [Cercospora beticola]PIA93667.1 hypothetical protein CB0940_03844 [Cercospora beticola]WPB01043.1 hypothetical protein RHO25_005663 [Cercospora beticola]CAK1364222.1 unnamed protein product [Cercospora beticola]
MLCSSGLRLIGPLLQRGRSRFAVLSPTKLNGIVSNHVPHHIPFELSISFTLQQDTAEAVGLAIALAGLFNDAIECFQYYSIGRDFKDSLATEQIKLHNAELRLSRWGKSIGISGDIRDSSSVRTPGLLPSFNVQNLRAGADKLEHIIALLKKANVKSAKYSAGQAGRPSGIEDNPSAVSGTATKLLTDMRHISIDRMTRQLRTKTKWALGGREQVQQLVSSITEQVKDLEDLYASPSSPRDVLADEEVNGISPQRETIALLSESARSREVQDTILETALRKKLDELAPSRNTFYAHYNGHNDSCVQSSQITGGCFIMGAKSAEISPPGQRP